MIKAQCININWLSLADDPVRNGQVRVLPLNVLVICGPVRTPVPHFTGLQSAVRILPTPEMGIQILNGRLEKLRFKHY